MAIDYVADRTETIKSYPNFTITQMPGRGFSSLFITADIPPNYPARIKWRYYFIKNDRGRSIEMNTRYKAGAGVLIAALFILADLSFLSAAGNAETPPDLRGAWKGTGEVYYPGAVKKIDTELNITEQDGWYFKGTRGWKLVDPPEKPLGYIMNTPVN